MRDRLNFNSFSLLPIVHEEMNGLAVATCVKGYAPNISNGYYGYQPVAQQVQNKNAREQHEQMDVTVTEHETRHNCNSRKRAWNYTDEGVLKRRRENDIVNDRGHQMMVKKRDVRFLEELLRETHGGDLYNYWTGDEV